MQKRVVMLFAIMFALFFMPLVSSLTYQSGDSVVVSELIAAGSKTWTINVPSNYDKVGVGICVNADCASTDSYNPDSFRGWAGYLEVNGVRIWTHDTSDFDYVDDKDLGHVYWRTYNGQYRDITNYVSAGSNTIKFYHFTDGNHGPKILIRTKSAVLCSDSDNGLIINVSGSCTDSTGTYADYCDSEGLVWDYYCGPLGDPAENRYCMATTGTYCVNAGYSGGCQSGKCVKETGVLCSDSDGGLNNDIAGSCTDSTGTYADYCDSEGLVWDYYCGPTGDPAENRYCMATTGTYCVNIGYAGGCQSGKCEKELAEEKLLEGDSTLDLGLQEYGSYTWDIDISSFTKAGIGIYNSNDATPNKYGGWEAYVEVNGEKIWENTANNEVYDYAKGKSVVESSYRDQYFDITNYVKIGKNTIKYYHFTDGKHGPKVTVYGGTVKLYEGTSVVVEEPKETEEKPPVYTPEPTTEAPTSAAPESPETKGETMQCDNGCAYRDRSCISYGTRKGGSYCETDKTLKVQKSGDESCDNNYECRSNVCVSDKCVGLSLIQTIMWFLKALLGV